ncbi:hypothetical protein WEB32_04575 [Streptomyces netropsis]|uniref:hypothetical protein n=1 Tax=Streptomyces netropsis TaxID=55404 RepID=UPI0030D3107E
MPVGNEGRSDLCLFIEPLGEDYWLNPGEVFTVGPESEEIDVWFETFVSKDCITVWLYEDGDAAKLLVGYTVVDADGNLLECGHQRPSGQKFSAAGPVME